MAPFGTRQNVTIHPLFLGKSSMQALTTTTTEPSIQSSRKKPRRVISAQPPRSRLFLGTSSMQAPVMCGICTTVVENEGMKMPSCHVHSFHEKCLEDYLTICPNAVRCPGGGPKVVGGRWSECKTADVAVVGEEAAGTAALALYRGPLAPATAAEALGDDAAAGAAVVEVHPTAEQIGSEKEGEALYNYSMHHHGDLTTTITIDDVKESHEGLQYWATLRVKKLEAEQFEVAY